MDGVGAITSASASTTTVSPTLQTQSNTTRRFSALTSRTVQVVTTVSPIRTGALKARGRAHEDGAGARQLRAQHRRDEAEDRHAMGDAAAEHGLARKVLVEMHRIHVAGDFAEQLDVALGHGLVEAVAHAGLQVVDVIGQSTHSSAAEASA